MFGFSPSHERSPLVIYALNHLIAVYRRRHYCLCRCHYHRDASESGHHSILHGAKSASVRLPCRSHVSLRQWPLMSMQETACPRDE